MTVVADFGERNLISDSEDLVTFDDLKLKSLFSYKNVVSPLYQAFDWIKFWFLSLLRFSTKRYRRIGTHEKQIKSKWLHLGTSILSIAENRIL